MRDSRRIQERTDLRLDRTAALWLTLGGLVAMGTTFALGVMVGRRAERLAAPAALPTAATDTLAELGEAQELHDKLTFYSKLIEPPRSSSLPSMAPAPEPVREAPQRAAPAPATGPEATPTAVRAPDSAPHPAAPTASDALGTALAAGPAKSGRYTVQVSSYQTIEEANAFAASLRRKGLAPYVVSAEIPSKGTWHRVRLGAFEDEPQALAAKQRLAAADIAAWVLKAE